MLGQAERISQLNSLMHLKDDHLEDTKIISITSGKGGTGKSFIASNIASELANKHNKVLLIDMDINLANLQALFNISTKKTLYNYFTYNQNLEELIYYCQSNKNLHLIFGESGKLDHPKLNEDRIHLFFTELKNLSKDYDVIILDTSSGIESGTLQLLLRSDEIILVTTPEPTSVMDAYVIFKLLKANGCKAISNIIVNKCFNKNEAVEAFQNLEKATKHFLKKNLNFLGEISFSKDVIKSIQSQYLITQSLRSGEIFDQIAQISNKLKITTIG